MQAGNGFRSSSGRDNVVLFHALYIHSRWRYRDAIRRPREASRTHTKRARRTHCVSRCVRRASCREFISEVLSSLLSSTYILIFIISGVVAAMGAVQEANAASDAAFMHLTYIERVCYHVYLKKKEEEHFSHSDGDTLIQTHKERKDRETEDPAFVNIAEP